MGERKKITTEIYHNYKQIRKLIEQHGKVRIIFADMHYSPTTKERTVMSEDRRRRIITKEGSCRVSYKSNGFRKWSGYGISCFVHHADSVKDFKKVLKLMRKHDGTHIIPIEVHYGFWFRNKVVLCAEE